MCDSLSAFVCLFEALPGGRGGEKKVIILIAIATMTPTVQFGFAGPPPGGFSCGVVKNVGLVWGPYNLDSLLGSATY